MTLTIFTLLDVLLMAAAIASSLHSSINNGHMAAAAAAAAADADNDVSSTSKNRQDIQVAIEEMQRANYFTFVMLINMAPVDLIPGNITFLMPNDKALSKNIVIPNENSVADFLLRHSIPSPLLFEHLEHFPTGSMLPTSKANLLLRITNDGRRRFFLNNVRITKPNICTRGSSIRCHGIDGVVQDLVLTKDPPPLPPPADCRNTSRTTSPPQLQAAPPTNGFNTPMDNSTSSSTAPPPAPGGADSDKNSANSLQIMRYFGVSAPSFIMLLLLKLSVL